MTSKDTIDVLTVIRNPLGGIRTYIKYVYGALPKGKYKFTIVIVREEEKDSSLIKSDLEKRGVSVRIIEVTGNNLNVALTKVVHKLLKKDHFDLIHSHGFTSGILTNFANLFKQIPHIVTSHDVFRADQFEGFKGKIKKCIIGRVLNQATLLQSVGEDAQENLIEYLNIFKKKTNKLIVIKNGIEVNEFAEKRSLAKGDIRKELRIAKDEFLFGFLGRFMPQKGFEYLIEAIDILSKNAKFKDKIKILAVNDGDFIKRYKKIINDKKLNEYFIFYGFVPDVGVIINDLDAILMPSLWEAFSLLPMESFLMGCPVIAANSIGLREVVKESPAVMVESRDGKSLANKIKYFIENKRAIVEETIKFIPLAEERYSIKHTAKELHSLFENVINERNANA